MIIGYVGILAIIFGTYMAVIGAINVYARVNVHGRDAELGGPTSNMRVAAFLVAIGIALIHFS